MSHTSQTGRFPSALSVTELNEYIKSLIDGHAPLTEVFVRGEISNFKNHYSSGHFYFSLKDEGSVLKAVMFRSAASRLLFRPESGMSVIAYGRISGFVRDGQYQLYVEAMEPDGVGSLSVAFEQLKRKLEAEGLFSEARKKPLPKLPTKIGIITSPSGAAVRDMIHVAGRRFPLAKLMIYPSLVQGNEAPQQLIAGIHYFNQVNPCDVIIIGRGGGSMEDLWCFNHEGLARAIAQSYIPVISAVGHETDFTISDFVADRRAPTPSAAMEIALPDTLELKRKFSNIIARETSVLRQILKMKKEKLSHLAAAKVLTRPLAVTDEKRMTLDRLEVRLLQAQRAHLQTAGNKLSLLSGQLHSLSPLAVLSRGYAAVYDADGNLVKSVQQFQKDDAMRLLLLDGIVRAKVTDIQKQTEE